MDGSEDERISSDEVVYDITSFGADFLVDGLVRRLESKDIFVPDFQRQFVWSVPQASRFIESVLLGLPIPGVFLYREEKSGRHLIIDGQQRLTTLASYVSGRFPNRNQVFRLQKVKEKWEGCAIEDISEEDRRRLMDTVIHATIIQQNSPKETDKSSVYTIFDRLNTGGTALRAQEVRAAIFRGSFYDMIVRLNSDENWRKLYGNYDKRLRDHEFILRHFAYRYMRAEYKEPYVKFLNSYLGVEQDIGVLKASKYESTFKKTIEYVIDALGEKAFRLPGSRVMNAAVFDSVSVIVAEERLFESLDIKAFRSRYKALLKHSGYLPAVTRSTGGAESVRNRFAIAKDMLGGQ